MSWTPKQFRAKIKGAQHVIIDKYEYMAKSAIAIGYASRATRPKEKRIFNAEKSRIKLETGVDYDKNEMEYARQMNQALKGYKPQFTPRRKGASR